MTISLTPRQADLLRFIESYQAERGYSPSIDEMAAHLGIKSRGSVTCALNGLQERGRIRRLRHHARAIELLQPLPSHGLRVVFGPGHFEDRARIKRAEFAEAA